MVVNYWLISVGLYIDFQKLIFNQLFLCYIEGNNFCYLNVYYVFSIW